MLMRCGARSGPGGWRWRAMAAQAACRGGLDCRLEGRAWEGAHAEHAAHVCDARGVKTQRLVERRRALPRIERRAYDAWRDAGRGLGGAQGMGGSHVEHVAHVFDAGCVKSQRLVE